MPYFLLVFAVLAPLSGALTMPAVFRLSSGNFRRFYPLSLLLCVFICCVSLILPVCRASRPFEILLSFPPGFDISLSADPLTVFSAVLVAAGCIISVFRTALSFTGTGKDVVRKFMKLNISYIFFSVSMILTVFSGSLLWTYIFWQSAIIFLWIITGRSRNHEDNAAADAMLVRLSTGTLCMLIGIILIYLQQGTFLLNNLSGESVSPVQGLLLLPAFFMPVVLFPRFFRFAAGEKDSGRSDFLLPASVMLFCGLSVFLHLFCACLAYPENLRLVINLFSYLVLSALIWSFFSEKDLNRKKALIVPASALMIIPGFSSATNIGFAGTLIALSASMLCIFSLLLLPYADKENIKEWNTAFALSAFTLAGLPPMPVFFSRLMIFSGLAQNGSPWLFAFNIFFSILFIFVLLDFYHSMKNQNPAPVNNGLTDLICIRTSLTAGIILLTAGILIYYPSAYAAVTAAVQGVNLQ
ncbi:MAG: hypothetical protein J6Z08_01735 [Elusimicrobiales bacterium]|nr:hypothetical protein [Elusimicrobiales bacterium]